MAIFLPETSSEMPDLSWSVETIRPNWPLSSADLRSCSMNVMTWDTEKSEGALDVEEPTMENGSKAAGTQSACNCYCSSQSAGRACSTATSRSVKQVLVVVPKAGNSIV